MNADNRLRANIVKELGQDHALDHGHIAVEVCRGVVRLSGHVATKFEKRRATAIAERMTGAGAVINSLKICPPSVRRPPTGQSSDHAPRT